MQHREIIWIQIQILPFWLLEIRTSRGSTTAWSVYGPDRTCFTPPPHCPPRVTKWAHLGPLQIQLDIQKLETIILPLLRPYVLAACQMRKKKQQQPFKHCQKSQLRFHLPSFEIEKTWLYRVLSPKQRMWMVRGPFNAFFL